MLEGTEKAMLIDCGMGIGDLRPPEEYGKMPVIHDLYDGQECELGGGRIVTAYEQLERQGFAYFTIKPAGSFHEELE